MTERDLYDVEPTALVDPSVQAHGKPCSPIPCVTDAPQWRLIGTDSESDSGVAPVCRQPDVHAMLTPAGEVGRPDDTFVYAECCGHPHLECWTPHNAVLVRDFLNSLGVEVCS